MPGRFRFSVPPRRHHTDPWFRIGQLDVTTTVLVSLLCAVTIIVYLVDSSLLEPFALLPDKVWDGQVWRLVTWPFVSLPDPQFLWTILRIALFWWFARELEAQTGRNRFAFLLAAITLGTGLVASGLDVSLFGLRYLELAAFVLFILEHPRARFFFGIPGWVIGAVFVGAEFLDLIGNRAFELALVLLVSLVIAALVGRMYGLAAEQTWLPNLAKLSAGSGSRPARPQRPAKTKSPGKRRGKGGRTERPSTVVSGPWAPPTRSSSADQAEVDSLLDKISANGFDSLTADEKRRLTEASERLRRRSD